jgi:bicarbonate transport system permease protein
LALQTWQSLVRLGTGYLAAALVGISLGILIGSYPIIYQALNPIFQFLRMVPPMAWVPISLAALQQNQPAVWFTVFITAVWPILLNTCIGVQKTLKHYRNPARVLQLPKQQFFFEILLPSVLPYIFTGLRVAISLAWLAVIAAEIVMSRMVGIGFFIWNAYLNIYISEVVLALVYITGVGLILDHSIAWIQSRLVR